MLIPLHDYRHFVLAKIDHPEDLVRLSMDELSDQRPWGVWTQDNQGNATFLKGSADLADEYYYEDCDAKLCLRPKRHPHAGLFLDGAVVRQWLKENALGKKILNTFCFTGSLSVVALMHGAEWVRNIDSSGSALRWANENHAANNIPSSKLSLIKDDVVVHLSKLKAPRYDLIILDPPSFGRAGNRVFSLRADGEALLQSARRGLLPDGKIIFMGHDSSLTIPVMKDMARNAGMRTLDSFLPVKEEELLGGQMRGILISVP